MGGFAVLLRNSRHLERVYIAQHGPLGFAVAKGQYAQYEPVSKNEGSLRGYTEEEKGS